MRRVLLIAIALTAVAPGPAGAALRATADDRSYVFTDEDGAADVVSLSVEPDAIVVTDTAGVVAGGGCTAAGQTLRCPRGKDVVLGLGAGDDRLTVGGTGSGPIGLQLSGDDGDDVLEGGPLGEQLLGHAGADVLRGGGGDDGLYAGEDASGADRLEGGDGRDHLHADDGPDVLDGGAGEDSVGFRPLDERPLAISFDGQANDGVPGQGALVLGAESAHGSWGDDTLIGSDGPDHLTGNFGDDVLIGAGGDDWLGGGAGADRFDGGDGSDRIDVFEGFDPGCGASSLCPADPGYDRADAVVCGASRDQVMDPVDANDRIDPSCENAFGDPWGTPRCGEFSCLYVPPAASLAKRSRTLVLPLHCRTAAGRCEAQLRLSLKGRTLAMAGVDLAAGERGVRIRLSRRAVKRLPRRRSANVVATLSAGGRSATRVVRIRRR